MIIIELFDIAVKKKHKYDRLYLDISYPLSPSLKMFFEICNMPLHYSVSSNTKYTDTQVDNQESLVCLNND